ncbi:hypothetical protein SK128_006271 [Halocaridina rubra]|uniref:Uncharacterized protein n=1 Tax=Halocaridina rubra TaxID=373956 RepID=A0AAN8ZRR4_HALRR
MTDKNSENDKAESNPPWYGNDRFMRFWHYYNTLMKTAHKDAIIRAHFASVRRRNHLTSLLLQMRGAPADDIKRPSMFTSSLRKSSVDSSRSNRNKKKRRRKKRNRRLREQARLNKQEGMSDTEVLYSQMSKGMHINDPEDEEEDMDVNEDFLQFLEHSHKHRNEWKVRKTNLLASTSGILGPPLTLGCISRVRTPNYT